MLRRESNASRAALLTVLLATVLALSGCVQVNVSSDFDSDGSARHAVTSTVDQSMLEDEMLDGEFEWNDIEESAREVEGIKFERVDEGDRSGVRVSTGVDDNADPGEALNELFNAIEPDSEPLQAFSGSFRESSSGFGGTTYRFELTVDGDTLFSEETGDLGDDVAMDIDAEMMRQFIELTYSASMPGEITDHNGTATSQDGQIQWELPLEGTATFTAESEESGAMSFGLIIGAGLGGLALVLLIVGSIFLIRTRSGPTQPAAASRDTIAD